MIDCFIAFASDEQMNETTRSLRQSPLVGNVFTLVGETGEQESDIATERVPTEGPRSSAAMKLAAQRTTAPYTLLCAVPTVLEMGYLALERMVRVMEDTGAGMVYADRYKIAAGNRISVPVNDYQFGSVRDDFDFGAVMLMRTDALREAVEGTTGSYRWAGLYDLRLGLSRRHTIVHIPEYLYSEVESDTRLSGQKLFDYVDPRNRDAQIEMEAACTHHLKALGGWLSPEGIEEITLDAAGFEREASIIIPVRNRIRTIEDAIRSALGQRTNFPFNLIVVDNHSDDGTTEAIRAFAGDERLVHIIPERRDLGIGGCWNLGANHPSCGRFAVQLDSDDVYKDESTLQTIVDTFHTERCAMVVGSYMMTDFEMRQIPPGVIDHREWTPDNGRNNALRVNGLGAPRAFYTPLLREIGVPNTSYGEDYALGLEFSRRWRIGRVWEVVYLCRRWDDNSDAALDPLRVNAHNAYKDKLRTWELHSRIALNESRK